MVTESSADRCAQCNVVKYCSAACKVMVLAHAKWCAQLKEILPYNDLMHDIKTGKVRSAAGETYILDQGAELTLGLGFHPVFGEYIVFGIRIPSRLWRIHRVWD